MPHVNAAKYDDLTALLRNLGPQDASTSYELPHLAVSTPAPAKLSHDPWPQAVEKVKTFSAVTQGRVDSLMHAQGLRQPDWRLPASLRPPTETKRHHPLSYLHLEDGSKLYMTQTLARGGFGKFRLGLWSDPNHPSNGQVVALKELRLSHWEPSDADFSRQPRTRVTQVTSARAELAHLTAPYSPVPVHGVVEHKGKLFISMPVLGEDLHTVTRKSQFMTGDPFDCRDLAMHVAYDAAETLMAMHASGMIHRDIKPENIMVGPDHRTHLVDMGLATEATKKQKATSAGTPGYMSPETVQRLGTNPSSDAWSLMVTVVTMAVGPGLFSPKSRRSDGSENLLEYKEFFSALPKDARGHIDVRSAIAAPHPLYSKLYDLLAEMDPLLADFVLNKGLNPDPDKRASVMDIKNIAIQLLAKQGLVPGEGSAFLKQISKVPHARELTQKQLEAFAQVMQSEAGSVKKR